MDISKSIRLSLAFKGHSRKWLAGKMGVSQQEISRICMAGKCGTDRLQSICKVLDTPVSDFIKLGE